MSGALATEDIQSTTRSILRIESWLSHRRLFILIILLSAVIYAQYKPLSQPSRGDRANWDYFAQVIARGGVPYRDVVNIKSPLSAYIGAAAIVAARPFGVRDIYAIRFACIVMLVLCVGMTYLVAREYFDSRRVGALSALIMLGFNAFGRGNVGGIQPKIPMILFGLMALWAIRKDRPFLAGVFAMLSALIWQPGLLFLGAAGLAFSRYLTSWRDLKVLKLLAGALLPLALQIFHLWIVGGLRDFYLWTIHYNFTVYAPGEVKSFAEFIDYLVRMLRGPFRHDRIYFMLAVIGATLVFFREVKQVYDGGWREALDGASRHALIIAPIVYFAFCSVNVQGSADMFPFVPFIAIFASVALIALIDGAGYLVARKRPGLNGAAFARACFAAACFFVFFLSVADAFIYRGTPFTLQQQEADVREMTSLLGPGDKVFTHGRTEILVISGLTNASRHFFLDRDKDVYMDRVEPGGFYGWFERLKAERPKIVALGRLRKVRHRNDFKEWVSRDYEVRQGKVFQYYVRKD